MTPKTESPKDAKLIRLRRRHPPPVSTIVLTYSIIVLTYSIIVLTYSIIVLTYSIIVLTNSIIGLTNPFLKPKASFPEVQQGEKLVRHLRRRHPPPVSSNPEPDL